MVSPSGRSGNGGGLYSEGSMNLYGVIVTKIKPVPAQTTLPTRLGMAEECILQGRGSLWQKTRSLPRIRLV